MKKRKSILHAQKKSPSLSPKIERNTGYSLANALRPTRDGTLFEYFLVVGAPLDTDTKAFQSNKPIFVTPQILFQYPTSSESNPAPTSSEFENEVPKEE